MIFGTQKANSKTDAIVTAIRPVMERAATQHGLPTGFWTDAYALGFLMGQINAHLADMDGEKLSVNERGKILVECFGALSGQKGKPLSEMAMVFAAQKNPDFLRANQNGMFMAKFKNGTLPDADQQPPVRAAEAELDEAGQEVTLQSVEAVLLRDHWVEEIRERFLVGNAG